MSADFAESLPVRSTHDGLRWRRRRDSNPRYRIYQYDGLANRWFQPLTHVSGSQRRAGPIAAGSLGSKRPKRPRNRLVSPRIRFVSSRIHCRFTRRGLSCGLDISRARERRDIMGKLSRHVRRGWTALAGAAALAASPALGQIQSVDPNEDLAQQPAEAPGDPSPYGGSTTDTQAP